MNSYNLVKLANLYGDYKKITHWAVSYRIMGKGDLFKRLREGKGITIATYNRVLQWFSDNWPVDLAWPSDIPRPAPVSDSPTEAVA